MLSTQLFLEKALKIEYFFKKMTKMLKFQLSITIIVYDLQKSLLNKEVFPFFVSDKNYGLNHARSLSC